ncbi:hypothetical protein CONPUDRAFT_83363 [Coniophora puteana RWD-64-598 SS2]|uniref:Carbohydrate-binding module family 13 protein n=1 Tax=Coniophora puteana (strain RWD-64-598) TaxID=741705 RepID=A0A5M3MJ86_CONPW|nr:uncharacterized protein CONPUDRAFT_83363 [Coniophora puteana RWD-64-598 SS2]EIW78990.1 hypothetical protein CONPUDRAFT_83363 [Coniophora puteana RWD-64-598 SS2]
MDTGSIRPGIYLILQYGGGTSMDLVGKRVVKGHIRHEGDTQKWELSPFGTGHSIKSLFEDSGMYITYDTDANVIATPYPVCWNIEVISGRPEPTIRIMWPNSPLAITLSSSTPDTGVSALNDYDTSNDITNY